MSEFEILKLEKENADLRLQLKEQQNQMKVLLNYQDLLTRKMNDLFAEQPGCQRVDNRADDRSVSLN